MKVHGIFSEVLLDDPRNISASPRHRELYARPSDERAGNFNEWPFPSVRYDYEAAHVGTGRRRPIEIDHDEIARVLAFFKSEKR